MHHRCEVGFRIRNFFPLQVSFSADKQISESHLRLAQKHNLQQYQSSHQVDLLTEILRLFLLKDDIRIFTGFFCSKKDKS